MPQIPKISVTTFFGKRYLSRLRAIARTLQGSHINMLSVLLRALFLNLKVEIYCFRIDKGLFPLLDGQSEFLIRKGTLEDLTNLHQNRPCLPWEFSCHKIDNVRDFFISSSDSELQHISWIYYKGDPNRIIRLREDEAEIKYCLTFDTFRGQGIYPSVLQSICQYLATSGYNRIFIAVDARNLPSIRGIQKAGFERTEAIRLVKVFGLQISKKYSSGGFD